LKGLLSPPSPVKTEVCSLDWLGDCEQEEQYNRPASLFEVRVQPPSWLPKVGKEEESVASSWEVADTRAEVRITEWIRLKRLKIERLI